jgi:uncharacterized protein (TIGR03085 family)
MGSSIREGLRRERSALADTLLSVGPGAPTLCAGWDAGDLAAHVVVRERRPDADLSLLLPWGVLRRWTDRVRDRVRGRTPFGELVEKVRCGSIFTKPALVEETFNLSELYVHHEDVRRGDGPAPPRAIPPEMGAALWRRLRRLAPLSFRGDRALRIDLVTPDGRAARIHPRGSGPIVTITGEPLELLLYAFGRRDAAFVEIAGNDESVARLEALSPSP